MTNEDLDERPVAHDIGRRRTGGELVSMGGFGQPPDLSFAQRASAAVAKMKTIRLDDCPACGAPGCTIARACKSRFDVSTEHGVDDRPMCKWATDEQVKRDRESQQRSRYDRLVRAGVADPHILATIPKTLERPFIEERFFESVFDARAYDNAGNASGYLVDRVENDWCLLVLFGGVGTGKSTLAAWGLARVDRGSFWLRSSVLDDYGRWSQVRERARSCGLLVVDDLGMESPGKEQWATEAMKQLLVERLSAGAATIVTTNLSHQGIVDRYYSDPSPENPTGTRLASRMLNGAKFVDTGKTDLRHSIGTTKTPTPTTTP